MSRSAAFAPSRMPESNASAEVSEGIGTTALVSEAQKNRSGCARIVRHHADVQGLAEAAISGVA